MRVVGGVPLWVECVFCRVDVVCLCLLYTQLLFWVRCFVLSVVCWCLCLWWPYGGNVLEYGSCYGLVCCDDRFLFVFPMLLMWVFWVSVLSCVLLLLWFLCVCCMWVWGRESGLVFLGWCSWWVSCCLFVVQVVCCILLGLVWREYMLSCLGWGWGCLSESMYVFYVGIIWCLLLLCLCRVLMLWWCRLRRSSVLLVPVVLECQMCICWSVRVIARRLVEHYFWIGVVLMFCFWMWCMLCGLWRSLRCMSFTGEWSSVVGTFKIVPSQQCLSSLPSKFHVTFLYANSFATSADERCRLRYQREVRRQEDEDVCVHGENIQDGLLVFVHYI